MIRRMRPIGSTMRKGPSQIRRTSSFVVLLLDTHTVIHEAIFEQKERTHSDVSDDGTTQ